MNRPCNNTNILMVPYTVSHTHDVSQQWNFHNLNFNCLVREGVLACNKVFKIKFRNKLIFSTLSFDPITHTPGFWGALPYKQIKSSGF